MKKQGMKLDFSYAIFVDWEYNYLCNTHTHSISSKNKIFYFEIILAKGFANVKRQN